MRKSIALRAIGLVAILVPLCIAPGCGTSCSKEDLGTVVYEVPNVPGSENAFPLPKLDPAAESGQPAGSPPNTAPSGEVPPVK